MTLRPDDVQPADADLVRATGVRDAAIVDAIHACTIFNVIDRIADALDFDIPPESDFYKVAPFLLKFGYKI